MQRRAFIGLVGGAAAWPVVVRAQQRGRIPVVGLPLLKGLVEQEYSPGKNILLQERYANEVHERYDALATELVNLKVDVLVASAIAHTPGWT